MKIVGATGLGSLLALEEARQTFF